MAWRCAISRPAPWSRGSQSHDRPQPDEPPPDPARPDSRVIWSCGAGPSNFWKCDGQQGRRATTLRKAQSLCDKVNSNSSNQPPRSLRPEPISKPVGLHLETRLRLSHNRGPPQCTHQEINYLEMILRLSATPSQTNPGLTATRPSMSILWSRIDGFSATYSSVAFRDPSQKP